MTKNNPLITIYITNYNYGKFIEASIESALAQNLQNFELLIIDDGSTDNSKEIIERYRSNPKVTIIYQRNKGLNVTNNIAMRASSGKYLMRLDADDFLEPEAIEKMSSVLENDKELGLVFPDYYYVDAEGIRIGVEKRHDFETEVTLYDRPAHGACTMIRLEFLKKLGGYNESFTCQDGYDLWLKFITHHKVTNVLEPLFSYRQHGNNLTTNEERILNTRKKMKEVFVKEHMTSPRTLVVIPVRNTMIKDINWPLYKVNDTSILERQVQQCLKSDKIIHIVISSSDKEILEFASKAYSINDRVSVLKRPSEYSGINETLGRTVEQALDFTKNLKLDIKAVMTLSLEYPNTTFATIDEAINTLALFNADCVLGTRPDNKMYYQHSGHSLSPILEQEKFTKLEREAIYKGAGGIVISSIENFIENKKLVSGSIGHIVVDEKSAFGVFSEFDFKIYTALINSKI